jgi:hypothetical protein
MLSARACRRATPSISGSLVAPRPTALALAVLASAFSLQPTGAQRLPSRYEPAIPRTWETRAIESLEVPLADPTRAPKHISEEAYYRLPVRPIYKTYPKYHPDQEPRGYIDWLLRQEPVIVWDDGPHRPKLETEADWIKAGELVFNSPIFVGPHTANADQMRTFIEKTGDRYDSRGISPFTFYVVRERGRLETGEVACAECHNRVMPDGSVIKGAQGNRPTEQVVFFGMADDAARARDPERFLMGIRLAERTAFGAPWAASASSARLDRFSAAEIEAVHFAIPPGVFARQGSSPLSPTKIPDLVGIKDRAYLDATGIVRHRDIGDIMRYAALNQGMDMRAHFGDFVPAADPRQSTSIFGQLAQARYSDEQLYALALFVYSLEAPPNPNKPNALTARGQAVFDRERCANCHTPPLYTNNTLMPVDGFAVPPEHRQRFDILPVSIGTDPTLTMTTRRGTGYYKVPSLKGVWYRGPFEHNGSVATLEDWFDARRLRDDYVPTGWKGVGVTTRAVKGHTFGLNLSADDKQALIAFLKTL